MEYIAVLGGLAVTLACVYFLIPVAKRRIYCEIAVVSWVSVLCFQFLNYPYRVARVLHDLGIW